MTKEETRHTKKKVCKIQNPVKNNKIVTSYKFYFLGTILATSALFGMFLWITIPLFTTQPQQKTIYVNASAKTNVFFPDGSSERPFLTISKAIQKTQYSQEFSKIFISSGVYTEEIKMPENTALYGVGDIVIQNPKQNSKTLTLNNNNLIYNIHIHGGKDAIFINPNTKTIIINSSATNATQYGIHTQKSEPDRTKGNTTIINSRIAKNALQGIYAQKGLLSISNSIIEENGEEGIDLHHSMETTVKNSTMRNNGESGLETEIQENIVTLINNMFEGNKKNGVNIQTGENTGSIIMIDNTIANNKKYGLRCAVHDPKPDDAPRPYFPYVTSFSGKNIFFENEGGNIDPECEG
ncbi:MAG: right-handed parallel beta-helix repeat-containing protein [Candidatus Moranbacteria bacterium]|nr:right-handed parallel beta-helix repeat-containing protein [Candidatus Moranbacteria bacterium]